MTICRSEISARPRAPRAYTVMSLRQPACWRQLLKTFAPLAYS